MLETRVAKLVFSSMANTSSNEIIYINAKIKIRKTSIVAETFIVDERAKGRTIVDSLGYRYSNATRLKNEQIRYMCSKRNSGCRACIFIEPNGQYIVSRTNQHVYAAHQ